MDTDITLDVRGLEPPEPLERVMDALPRLEPGRRLRLLIHREPHPLYALLARRGFAYSARALDGPEYEILIWRMT